MKTHPTEVEMTRTRKRCTCGGTAPEFPQHESFCELVSSWDDSTDPEHEDYMRSVLSDDER